VVHEEVQRSKHQIRGLLVASRGHFSDNGCVSGASQAAEGQSISCVPRSVFRYNSCVPDCRGRTERL